MKRPLLGPRGDCKFVLHPDQQADHDNPAGGRLQREDQMQFARSRHALPITRDYIAEAEARYYAQIEDVAMAA